MKTQMSIWSVLGCLIVLLSAPAAQAKRVALVIGNDVYTNMPAAQQLQKAVNDARTIGRALTSLGFDVTIGTNLGRQAMVDRLSDFTAKLAPGDTAALFFAGHGVAIGGVNYLVPSDVPPVNEGAEARVRGASLAEPDIIAEIQAKSVSVALLVIDACRDNPFPRNAGRSIGSSRGLADAKPARGIFTIYSAGIGQTALDRLTDRDPEPNSVFTRIFAEELVKPGLHLGDLAVETRERVAALALRATDRAGNPAPTSRRPPITTRRSAAVSISPAPPSTHRRRPTRRCHHASMWLPFRQDRPKRSVPPSHRDRARRTRSAPAMVLKPIA